MFTFTDMAVDYSVDELDDLTTRKVAPEGIDGDRLARIIRARRGTARATGNVDPYPLAAAEFNVWGAARALQRGGDRRMAAVGRKDKGLGQPVRIWDDPDALPASVLI